MRKNREEVGRAWENHQASMQVRPSVKERGGRKFGGSILDCSQFSVKFCKPTESPQAQATLLVREVPSLPGMSLP